MEVSDHRSECVNCKIIMCRQNWKSHVQTMSFTKVPKQILNYRGVG